MKLFLVGFLVWGAMPAVAFAQAAIAGSVKDASGAPLPRGRWWKRAALRSSRRPGTAITDGNGRYRIEDLRPGVYAVRFTLAGWGPSQREGVELTGSFTATVDATLAIGRLTDTVTVIGEPSVVDVHTAKHEVTLSGEVVRSIPTVRSYNALLVLVPGVVTSSNDTVTGTATTSFPMHGGRQNEGRLLLDGLNVGSPPVGNSATNYVVDTGHAQEVTFLTGRCTGRSRNRRTRDEHRAEARGATRCTGRSSPAAPADGCNPTT